MFEPQISNQVKLTLLIGLGLILIPVIRAPAEAGNVPRPVPSTLAPELPPGDDPFEVADRDDQF